MSKVVFLDIDGTLVDRHQSKINDLVIEGIRQARKNGHKVLLCTGRTRFTIQNIIHQIELDGWVVSAGGFVEIDGKEIYENHCKQESVELAIEIMNRNQIYYRLESDYKCFQSDEMTKRFYYIDESDLATFREKTQTYPLENYRKEKIQTIYFFALNINKIQEMKDKLSDLFQLMIYNIDSNGVVEGELINKEVDKAKGMEKVLEYYHIQKEDSIAFGDSMNDASMLKYAEIGVAMGNASEEVKKIADHTCESCRNNGIYYEMKRLGLL